MRKEVATSSLASKCNNHPSGEIVSFYSGIEELNNFRKAGCPSYLPEHPRSGIEREGTIAFDQGGAHAGFIRLGFGHAGFARCLTLNRAKWNQGLTLKCEIIPSKNIGGVLPYAG
jgi:hypothetical protein